MKRDGKVKNENKHSRQKEPEKMQRTPQNLLKEYVKSQNFTSTGEIMAAMKEMFRDVLEQVLEVEMDEELGRERCQRASGEESEQFTPNYRNGYSRNPNSVVYC